MSKFSFPHGLISQTIVNGMLKPLLKILAIRTHLLDLSTQLEISVNLVLV